MLIDCSIALLNAVRKRQRSEIIRIQNLLYTFEFDDAQTALSTDKEKIVFWANIYNAFFQLKAREKLQVLTNSRGRFFKEKQVELFNIMLSFDDIEHRILRRSKLKYGLGYVPTAFKRKWERILRVDKPDFRVHFILNCGVESCPVIYPLTLHNYEIELDASTHDYLEREVSVSDENKRIELNQLFLFYRADFGGRDGIRKMLRENDVITREQVEYKCRYTPLDKTLKLDNFVRGEEMLEEQVNHNETLWN